LNKRLSFENLLFTIPFLFLLLLRKVNNFWWSLYQGSIGEIF